MNPVSKVPNNVALKARVLVSVNWYLLLRIGPYLYITSHEQSDILEVQAGAGKVIIRHRVDSKKLTTFAFHEPIFTVDDGLDVF